MSFAAVLSITGCTDGSPVHDAESADVSTASGSDLSTTTSLGTSDSLASAVSTERAEAGGDASPDHQPLGFIDWGRIATPGVAHGSRIAWDMVTLFNRTSVLPGGPQVIEILDVTLEASLRGSFAQPEFFSYSDGTYGAVEQNGTDDQLPEYVKALHLPAWILPVDPDGPGKSQGMVQEDVNALALVWSVEFTAGDVLELGGILVTYRVRGSQNSQTVLVSQSAGLVCVFESIDECE